MTISLSTVSQGASEDNMLDFARQYEKDLALVILTHNYRSTQPILDISKQLISKNAGRLIYKMDNLSKDLVSSNKLNFFDYRSSTHPGI